MTRQEFETQLLVETTRYLREENDSEAREIISNLYDDTDIIRGVIDGEQADSPDFKFYLQGVDTEGDYWLEARAWSDKVGKDCLIDQGIEFTNEYAKNIEILYDLHVEALKLGENYTLQPSMGGEYSVEQDHKDIKEQIKSWEQKIDSFVRELSDDTANIEDIVNELENMSHEMMAING